MHHQSYENSAATDPLSSSKFQKHTLCNTEYHSTPDQQTQFSNFVDHLSSVPQTSYAQHVLPQRIVNFNQFEHPVFSTSEKQNNAIKNNVVLESNKIANLTTPDIYSLSATQSSTILNSKTSQEQITSSDKSNSLPTVYESSHEHYVSSILCSDEKRQTKKTEPSSSSENVAVLQTPYSQHRIKSEKSYQFYPVSGPEVVAKYLTDYQKSKQLQSKDSNDESSDTYSSNKSNQSSTAVQSPKSHISSPNNKNAVISISSHISSFSSPNDHSATHAVSSSLSSTLAETNDITSSCPTAPHGSPTSLIKNSHGLLQQHPTTSSQKIHPNVGSTLQSSVILMPNDSDGSQAASASLGTWLYSKHTAANQPITSNSVTSAANPFQKTSATSPPMYSSQHPTSQLTQFHPSATVSVDHFNGLLHGITNLGQDSGFTQNSFFTGDPAVSLRSQTVGYQSAPRFMIDPSSAHFTDESLPTFPNAAAAPNRLPAHKPVRLTQPKHALAPPGTPVYFKYGEEHYPEETVPPEYTFTETDGTVCRYITNFLVYNKRGERLQAIEVLDQPRHAALVLYGSLLPAIAVSQHDAHANRNNIGRRDAETQASLSECDRPGRKRAANNGIHGIAKRHMGNKEPQRATTQTYPVRVELAEWCIDYGQEPTNVPFIWLISRWDVYYRLEKPAGRYISNFSTAKMKFEVSTRVIKTLQYRPDISYKTLVDLLTAATRLEKLQRKAKRKALLKKERENCITNTCFGATKYENLKQEQDEYNHVSSQAPAVASQQTATPNTSTNITATTTASSNLSSASSSELMLKQPLSSEELFDTKPSSTTSTTASSLSICSHENNSAVGVSNTIKKKNRNWRIQSLSTPQGTGVVVTDEAGRPQALTPWGAPYAVDGFKQSMLLGLAEFLESQLRNFMEGVGGGLIGDGTEGMGCPNLLNTPFMQMLREKTALRMETIQLIEAKRRALEVAKSLAEAASSQNQSLAAQGGSTASGISCGMDSMNPEHHSFLAGSVLSTSAVSSSTLLAPNISTQFPLNGGGGCSNALMSNGSNNLPHKMNSLNTAAPLRFSHLQQQHIHHHGGMPISTTAQYFSNDSNNTSSMTTSNIMTAETAANNAGSLQNPGSVNYYAPGGMRFLGHRHVLPTGISSAEGIANLEAEIQQLQQLLNESGSDKEDTELDHSSRSSQETDSEQEDEISTQSVGTSSSAHDSRTRDETGTRTIIRNRYHNEIGRRGSTSTGEPLIQHPHHYNQLSHHLNQQQPIHMNSLNNILSQSLNHISASTLMSSSNYGPPTAVAAVSALPPSTNSASRFTFHDTFASDPIVSSSSAYMFNSTSRPSSEQIHNQESSGAGGKGGGEGDTCFPVQNCSTRFHSPSSNSTSIAPSSYLLTTQRYSSDNGATKEKTSDGICWRHPDGMTDQKRNSIISSSASIPRYLNQPAAVNSTTHENNNVASIVMTAADNEIDCDNCHVLQQKNNLESVPLYAPLYNSSSSSGECDSIMPNSASMSSSYISTQQQLNSLRSNHHPTVLECQQPLATDDPMLVQDYCALPDDSLYRQQIQTLTG